MSQFAKLLIESPKFGCGSEVLAIVAMLSGMDPDAECWYADDSGHHSAKRLDATNSQTEGSRSGEVVNEPS